MATAIQPRACDLLEEGGKIAQGVPDQRDLNKFVRLLRYFSRQSKFIDQSTIPAHTVSTRKKPSMTIVPIAPASSDTCPAVGSDIIRITTVNKLVVSGSSPKPGPDFHAANPVGLGGVDNIASDREPESQQTRPETDTAGSTITHPGDSASNPASTKNRAIGPAILGEEHKIISEPSPVLASSSLDTSVSLSEQKRAQEGPELPNFKIIHGRSQQLGKGRIWRKVQAFTTLGSENLYLATNLSPGAEYSKQWEEKWEPTLRAEIWDLIIDQNDIFTFDLRMAGHNPDQLSMKPTILIICNESRKSTIESKLGGLVKQTVPKEVCFRVVGRRVSLASGGEFEDFARPGLTVDIEKSGWNNYHTMMGSAALIHEGPSLVWKTGFAQSTIGGLIAVDNALYALTTAHSMFKEPLHGLHELQMSRMLESCGKVERFKWSNMPMKKMGRDTQGLPGSSKTPMDWALISVLDNQFLPNNFIHKTHPVSCSVQGFMRDIDFPAVEDVWICSCTLTSGILSNTLTTVVVGNVAFQAHTILLENCLVDGDSGSWVISQTTHKLCGYIFAKVDGMEIGYMLPVEPILNDISREMSKDIKVDVRVPDSDTISRLVELMKRKPKETEDLPEVLARPSLETTSVTATTPNLDMAESLRSATSAENVENWQRSMENPNTRPPPDHRVRPAVYNTSFRPPSEEGLNKPPEVPFKTRAGPPTALYWSNRSTPPPSRPAPILPEQEITSSPSHSAIPTISPHLKLLADEILRNDPSQPAPRSDVDLQATCEPERPLRTQTVDFDPGLTLGSRVEMSELRYPDQPLHQQPLIRHISQPHPVRVGVDPPHSQDPVGTTDIEDHHVRRVYQVSNQPRQNGRGSQLDPRRRSRRPSWTWRWRPSTSLVLISVLILIASSTTAGFGYLCYWIIEKSSLSNGGKGGAVFAAAWGWFSILSNLLWGRLKYGRLTTSSREPEMAGEA